MDKNCFYNGSCHMCGCETTALQMANKSCKKPCYPAMMNRKEWKTYMRGGSFFDNNGAWTPYLSLDGKPTLINPKEYHAIKRIRSNKS
jgi:hypothetical protein